MRLGLVEFAEVQGYLLWPPICSQDYLFLWWKFHSWEQKFKQPLTIWTICTYVYPKQFRKDRSVESVCMQIN